MLLSFLSAKILAEFDEIAASTFVKLFVSSTEDGSDLLVDQGFDVV